MEMIVIKDFQTLDISNDLRSKVNVLSKNRFIALAFMLHSDILHKMEAENGIMLLINKFIAQFPQCKVINIETIYHESKYFGTKIFIKIR
jgi:hypothetical protein